MEESKVSSCPENLEEAGRASGCQGCPGQALCQSQAGRDPAQDALNIRMRAIKHKVIVMSGKGGVGKSTVAACLAARLALRGATVAALDTDICGPSLPTLLAVSDQEITNSQWGWLPPLSPCGVKVLSVGSMLPSADAAVALRGPRKTHLVRSMLRDTLWGRLTYLIIDTPPGTSDEHLSLARLLRDTRPDGVVLVTTPQDLVCGVVRRQVTFCRKVGLNIIGMVENMAEFECPCCKERYPVLGGTGAAGRLAADLGIPLLGTLPLDPALATRCESGSAHDCLTPESTTERALGRIVEKVVRHCEK
ncbi:Cytosolic Fe-S cluster assembly factor nubp1-A [Amphibalanus amphitrite]|uniref:Cytosolic Fe-S cluster assembly factor nubp1-A n=1 Tax=Amphibalanus amphitrite TaxID=1232801 RepID=A0A6A4X4E9_AMPAM|nr:Cytosolic Fe-S cluster assembly factor nubp1-A [Amphibalanus amphitrite]